ETQVFELEGNPEDLWLGDVDGDGVTDAVVATSVRGGLTVFTANLTRRERVELGEDLSAVEVADLEGDGSLEIVAADFSDSALYVLPARGASEATPVRSEAGPAPESLRLFDLDGDGKLEAWTHGRVGPEIWVHRGEGEGRFGPPQVSERLDERGSAFALHRDERGVPWLLTGADRGLVAGELDGEARVVRRVTAGHYLGVTGVALDQGLALAREEGGFAHYHLTPVWTFPEVWRSGSVGANVHALAFGDLTGDGIVDLAAAIGEKAVRIFAGRPDGQWQEASSVATSERVLRMAVADVTGDGRGDLVLVDTNGVTIAVGQGDGTFVMGPPVSTRVTVRVLHAFARSAAGAVAIADVRESGEPGVDVLTFDGSGHPVGATTPIAEGHARQLASADLDGDGLEELVALVVDGEEASLVIAPPDGEGWGALDVRALSGLKAMLGKDPFAEAGLGLGELDQDGAIDGVLVARDAIVRLYDLAADGPPEIDPDARVRGADVVAVAQVDGDGLVDVVYGKSGKFSVALAQADGALRVQASYGEPIEASALSVEPTELRVIAAQAAVRGISILAPGIGPSLGRDGIFHAPEGFATLKTGDVDGDGVTDVVVGELPRDFGGGVSVLWGRGDGPPRVATGKFLFWTTGVLGVGELDGRPGGEILAVSLFGFQVLSFVDGRLEVLDEVRVDEFDVLAGATLARPGEVDDIVMFVGAGDRLRVRAWPRAAADALHSWEESVVLWEGPRRSTSPFDAWPAWMIPADFDGDGFTDVAVSAGEGEPVRVVWGDAERTAPTTELPLVVTRAPAVGDLDGDGLPELAVITELGVVQVDFSGRSPGEAVVLAEGCAGDWIMLADFEGDGAADLVCWRFTDVLALLRAPGRADAWVTLRAGSRGDTMSMRAVELDGDGILDLAAVRFGGGVDFHLSREVR
ncbi:MAG TPA: VCBS repeat-containing protein, partial [Nannocystis sp.]